MTYDHVSIWTLTCGHAAEHDHTRRCVQNCTGDCVRLHLYGRVRFVYLPPPLREPVYELRGGISLETTE